MPKRMKWHGPSLVVISLMLLRAAMVPGLAFGDVDAAGPTTAPAPLTPQQEELLRKAKELNDQVNALYGQQKYAEAVPLAEEVARIRMQAVGEQSADYAQALNNLGELFRELGKDADAEPLLRNAVAISRRTLGDQSQLYGTSLDNLAALYEHRGDAAKAAPLRQQAKAIKDKIDRGKELAHQVTLLYGLAKFAQALPMAHEVVQIRKETLGEQHPDYAAGLNNLAALYHQMGDYAKAEPLYQEAMRIWEQALGEQHPTYTSSLNNLAALYENMGEYAKAELLFRKAVQVRKQALGEHHPQYATSLNNLAGLYERMGAYDQAEPLDRQAMQIWKQALGEQHPDYAASLNNLAALYWEMGDYANAEPLYRQAMQIWKQTSGEHSPQYASCLDNLAELYRSMGAYAMAEPLCRQALQIRQQVLGEHHPACAASLNKLAQICEHAGDYGKAEPLYRQAIQIRKEALGEHHPDYASSLNNLAALYHIMGDYSRAEPLYLQANQIRKEALGEQHPACAEGLNNLALLCADMGDPVKAESLSRTALSITHRQVELTAGIQSERQQLLAAETARANLGEYLSFSASVEAGDVYDRVLAWKGLVTFRQTEMRAERPGSADPKIRSLRTDLDQTARKLALLTRAVPDAATLANPGKLEARRHTLDELSRQVEQLQYDLSVVDADYRKVFERKRRTAADLAAALPPEAVLVDVRQYTCFTPRREKTERDTWDLRLVAFVVRKGSKVARIELGATAPVETQVQAWRRTCGAGAAGVAAGAELRKLIWQPLLEQAREQMAGASVVLLSPDGPLCQFPLAALPGSKEGYLIEELAACVVPVPAALPELLAEARPADTAPPSLLLVGGVDYGQAGAFAAASQPANNIAAPVAAAPDTQPAVVASAGPMRRSAPRGDDRPAWPSLPGTRTEVARIGGQFADRFPAAALERLGGSEATVAALRQAAPRFRWVHIATHGFFASEQEKSAEEPARGADRFGADEQVAGFHPGLLSGIVLAGANHPVDGDDGILTALEVQEMDLSHLDMAVLSACDTGLGRRAGGEGLLGLQRALQVAGARTSVASLWKVQDDTTRNLMTRFYRALWQENGEAGKGKLAALRQAQLQTMREGSVDDPNDAADVANTGRLPPRYWAAFVLSGDWR